jgi:hypothetical protein
MTKNILQFECASSMCNSTATVCTVAGEWFCEECYKERRALIDSITSQLNNK